MTEQSETNVETSVTETPVTETTAENTEVTVEEVETITSDAVTENNATESAVADASEETPKEETTVEDPVTAETSAEQSSDVTAEATTEASTEENSESTESDDAGDAESDEDGPVVKLLSVGQRVPGTVRRITDFGAFVDIGVGRDGLIHVSELSVRRVGKVADVLQENQEIEVWIKKLDRDRNRISLTMIEPGTKTIRDLEKGELVNGKVTRILPYGAFIDIGIGRDALLHIREMSEGYVARPEDVVSVGEELEARVIELSRRRQRVDLSIKGLRPEPELELPPEAATEANAAAEEDDVVDEFANVEVLSPMELAFKRAMEAEGIELDGKKKRRKGKRGRSIQDEIIARTLDVSKD